MNDALDADRTVALNHVPWARQAAVSALWTLDVMLGRVVSATTEPTVGRIRLTWWHERLAALETGERLSEPVLRGLAAHVLGHGVDGSAMATLVDGWDALLDPPPLSVATLGDYARDRGGRLFALTAVLLGGSEPVDDGVRWALVDLAMRATEPLASAAREAALALRVGGSAPKALRLLTQIGSIRLRRPAGRIGVPLTPWEGLCAMLG